MNRISLVYQIVFYNGVRKWSHSRDICDLVDAPEEPVNPYFLKLF